VFVAAEAVTDLRDKLTEAVTASVAPVHEPATPAHEPRRIHEPAQVRERPGKHPQRTRRTTFAEYLATARAHLTDSTVVTPKWCRQVTGCSAGTSVKLAATLTTPGAP
jgi:hypothetical protein